MSKLKAVLLFIAALILGPVIAWFGYKEFVNSGKLMKTGESVMATASEARVSGRRSKSYHLTVQFQTKDGKKINQEVDTDKATYDSAVAGNPVKVYYLPEDPTVAIAADQPSRKFGMLLGGVIFFFSSFYFLNEVRKPA